MTELELKGCRSQPLMSYLKALGVLRLVAEQVDDGARGRWNHGTFHLRSNLDKEGVLDFFEQEYVPTPIVVPWGGGDFFDIMKVEAKPPYKKTPTSSTVIEAFLLSKSERLKTYNETIATTLDIIRRKKITKDNIDGNKYPESKARFLAYLRSCLPDDVVRWMDVTTAVTRDRDQDKGILNTLLGSGGGIDANTHFSDNFMQNLWDCLPDFKDQKAKKDGFDSRRALAVSLFGVGRVQLKWKRTAALFDSGAVGGPNATQGMERKSIMNPWDFILAIEGTLCLAGAIARRRQAGSASHPAFPFTVDVVAAGYGTSVKGDANDKEIWLPIWHAPLAFKEMTMIFSEGRAQSGRRVAHDAMSFALAVSNLGVDAGIRSFIRYGIMKGRVGGTNYHTAAPLGRFEVKSNPEADLIRDLYHWNWLNDFRKTCKKESPRAPSRFPSALARFDSAVFDFCKYGGKFRFGAILRAVGRIERELSELSGKVAQEKLNPVPPLSNGWITASNDDSPEFRIALALAGIGSGRLRGTRKDKPATNNDAELPLRCNLEHVVPTSKGFRWADKDRRVVWSSVQLSRNLFAILQRRFIDAADAGEFRLPLDSPFDAKIADIRLLLRGETDDRLIEDYLWGLVNVRHEGIGTRIESESGRIPRSYALLKLLFLRNSHALKSPAAHRPLWPDAALFGRLRSGDVSGACETAARRLRISGFIPKVGGLYRGKRRSVEFCDDIDPIRLAASLLIPIVDSHSLMSLVLRPKKDS